MNLKSQETRRLAPEMDPLRMGMGWTAQDLEKPQVLIESTYGQSHPGSAHLHRRRILRRRSGPAHRDLLRYPAGGTAHLPLVPI